MTALPEQQARQTIDAMLAAAGWAVQDDKAFDINCWLKETRRRRWERLDEDLAFTEKELDRSIVVPSQIRTVLTAYRNNLFTELFPGRCLGDGAPQAKTSRLRSSSPRATVQPESEVLTLRHPSSTTQDPRHDLP